MNPTKYYCTIYLYLSACNTKSDGFYVEIDAAVLRHTDNQPWRIWTRKFSKTKGDQLGNSWANANGSKACYLSDPPLPNFRECENGDSEIAAQEHSDEAVNCPDDNEDIPIVIVHGMGAAGAVFFVTVDSLVKHSTVYMIDLPGKRLLYLECMLFPGGKKANHVL